MRSLAHILWAVPGLLLFGAAACRSAASPIPSVEPPPPVTATIPATAAPDPWVLVDPGVSAAIQDAVRSAAAEGGFDVQVHSVAEAAGKPPVGLWAVVAEEADLTAAYPEWSAGGIAFVVLEPTSLTASSRTSTIGPDIAYDEEGFLVGVAAGLATESGVVGRTPVTGQPEAGDFWDGFAEGMLYACPKCQLEEVVDISRPSFAVDVIATDPWFEWPSGDPPGGPPWLVVVAAPADPWADHVAARVEVAPQQLVGPALMRLWEGMAGEAWDFAASNASLGTSIDSRAISPGKERLLREAEQALAEGWLAVGEGGEQG